MHEKEKSGKMKNQEMLFKAQEIFLGEASSKIEEVKHAIARLQIKPGDVEAVSTIARVAHALKGTSQMVGFSSIAQLARQMEEVLAYKEEQEAILAANVCTALTTKVCAIEEVLDNARKTAGNLAGKAETKLRKKVDTAYPGSVILVVDDDLVITELLVTKLTEIGYQVKACYNAAACLEFLRVKEPDLIILDVMLPDMDGFELYYQIKAQEKFRNTPVIFLTACAEIENKVLGLRLGADDYLTKPFEFEELAARVEMVLARAERFKDEAVKIEPPKSGLKRKTLVNEAELATSEEINYLLGGGIGGADGVGTKNGLKESKHQEEPRKLEAQYESADYANYMDGERRITPGATPVEVKPKNIGPLKVLVADDDRLIVRLLESRLSNEGYQVITANDGLTALSLVEQEKPDLVIIDGIMPKLDGFEVCRRLRENSATVNIPVIMLTAKKQEADIVKGLELGADDYVLKPFSPVELTSRIKRVLARRA